MTKSSYWIRTVSTECVSHTHTLFTPFTQMCTHCTQTKCYLHFFLINDIPVLLWVTGQSRKAGWGGQAGRHTRTADNRCFSRTPHPYMTGSTATSLTTDDFTVTDDSAARQSDYTRHKTLTWAWKHCWSPPTLHAVSAMHTATPHPVLNFSPLVLSYIG